jgi:hypothetical protein
VPPGSGSAFDERRPTISLARCIQADFQALTRKVAITRSVRSLASSWSRRSARDKRQVFLERKKYIVCCSCRSFRGSERAKCTVSAEGESNVLCQVSD